MPSFNDQAKPIFTSLSPNVEKDDLKLCFELLWRPRQWRKGGAVGRAEEWFRHNLGIQRAFAFNSGRAAFLAILRALQLPQNSEVLLSGFTCNALVNPVIWSGLKPVFADIRQDSLNLDLEDLKTKITPQSKALVVQHTFGMPERMDEVLALCRQHNLILIEDCAHGLGGQYNGRRLGTFGQAAFFSFGRDKIISSVSGGVAATSDSQLAARLASYRDSLPAPSYFWILQQLLHPIITSYIAMPLYRWPRLGKLVLVGLQKTGIISKAVTAEEKGGLRPGHIPRKLPAALAELALRQLNKLTRFNNHRRKIASYYALALEDLDDLELPVPSPSRLYLRYSVLLEQGSAAHIINVARGAKIFLDDGWRKANIVPPDTDQAAMQYTPGSCPNAERVAKKIINLPTHINTSFEEAKRVVTLLRRCAQSC